MIGWRYWTVVVLMWAAAVLILSACATDRDYAGNLYPPECPRDMRVDAIIDYVTDGELQGLAFAFGKPEVYGLTVRLGPGPAFIWVRADDGMPERLRRDILRHEMCHAIKGQWHG